MFLNHLILDFISTMYGHDNFWLIFFVKLVDALYCLALIELQLILNHVLSFTLYSITAQNYPSNFDEVFNKTYIIFHGKQLVSTRNINKENK